MSPDAGDVAPTGKATPVCVVIPCRNEAHTIKALVMQFRDALPTARLLVLDNGSTDATAHEATAGGAEVLHVPTPGKGVAMRAAISHLRGEYAVLFIDGDGTYSPADAVRILSPVLEGIADMAVGERFTRAEKGAFIPPRKLGNRIVTFVVNTLFGTRCIDVLSGYRALSPELLARIHLSSVRFEIETEILAEASRVEARVVEVPVSYRARHAQAHSKLMPVADAARIIWTAARLRAS